MPRHSHANRVASNVTCRHQILPFCLLYFALGYKTLPTFLNYNNFRDDSSANANFAMKAI